MWGWGVFFYFPFQQIPDLEQNNTGQTQNKSLSSSASFTNFKEKNHETPKRQDI